MNVPRSREAQKQAQQIRYAEYVELLAEHGVEPEWKRWSAHRRELQMQYGVDVDRRYTREELKAWWLARFTHDEIWWMASAIDGAV